MAKSGERRRHSRDEIKSVNQPIGQRPKTRIIGRAKLFSADAGHAECIYGGGRRVLGQGCCGSERRECGTKAMTCDEERFTRLLGQLDGRFDLGLRGRRGTPCTWKRSKS